MLWPYQRRVDAAHRFEAALRRIGFIAAIGRPLGISIPIVLLPDQVGSISVVVIFGVSCEVEATSAVVLLTVSRVRGLVTAISAIPALFTSSTIPIGVSGAEIAAVVALPSVVVVARVRGSDQGRSRGNDTDHRQEREQTADTSSTNQNNLVHHQEGYGRRLQPD